MSKYKRIECDVCGREVTIRCGTFRYGWGEYNLLESLLYAETKHVCSDCLREIGRRVREQTTVDVEVR